MHGWSYSFVHSHHHLQGVIPLFRKLLVDIPNYRLNVIQLRLCQLVSRARLHGQIDGQVVAFNEGEERGLHQTGTDQAGNGYQKHSKNDAEHDPRLAQGKSKDRRVKPIAQSIHQIPHEALQSIGLEVPPQRFGVANVCR